MAKTKLLKKKHTKVSTVKKKVWKLFSEYIRLRDCLETMGLPDYGKCITCSKIIPRTLLQAGHFVAGRHSSNLFSELGVHAQCYNCNINLKGNTLVYRRKIIELYGEGADLGLEDEARQVRKFIVPELEEMIIEYTEKIEELKLRNQIPKEV